MSLKKSYDNKEELMADIIDEHGLPEGVTFVGINKYNQGLFDFNITKNNVTLSELSEIEGKTNFVERYFLQLQHLIKQ